MKKITLLFFGLLCITDLYSQSEKPNSSCLSLYSGRVIYSDYIQYNKPYFNTDKGRFFEDSVSFYMNRSGSFGNTRHLRKRNPTYFMQAVTFKNLNLYSQTVTIIANNTTSTKDALVYNKGTDILKKANYKNLKFDMADNAESMRILRQVRNIRNAEFGIYALSLSCLVIGIVNLAKDGPEYLQYGAIPLSLGLYKVTVLGNSKQKKIIKAFQAYDYSSPN